MGGYLVSDDPPGAEAKAGDLWHLDKVTVAGRDRQRAWLTIDDGYAREVCRRVKAFEDDLESHDIRCLADPASEKPYDGNGPAYLAYDTDI